MPVWRMDDDGRRISLIITRSGRNAIGVEDDAGETQPPVETRSAKPSSATVTAENPPLEFVPDALLALPKRNSPPSWPASAESTFMPKPGVEAGSKSAGNPLSSSVTVSTYPSGRDGAEHLGPFRVDHRQAAGIVVGGQQDATVRYETPCSSAPCRAAGASPSLNLSGRTTPHNERLAERDPAAPYSFMALPGAVAEASGSMSMICFHFRRVGEDVAERQLTARP